MKNSSIKIYIKKVRSDKNNFRFQIDTNFKKFPGAIYYSSKNENLPKILKGVFNSCIQYLGEIEKTFLYKNFTVFFNKENYIEGKAQYNFHKNQDSESDYHTFSMVNGAIWQTVPMSQEEIDIFSDALIILRNSVEVYKL